MARPARVIIVDDDPRVGESLSALLVQEGLAVEVAPSAEGALALCTRQHYDAALVGMRLTDVAGIDLLRALRRADPALRAIVITAQGGGSLARRAMAEGAEAVLQRPLEVTPFLPLLLV
ncbi:MAG: response regulator [Chloroflexi bacterium]|nr:response regulator [Chloroflexota bacterium]